MRWKWGVVWLRRKGFSAAYPQGKRRGVHRADPATSGACENSNDDKPYGTESKVLRDLADTASFVGPRFLEAGGDLGCHTTAIVP